MIKHQQAMLMIVFSNNEKEQAAKIERSKFRSLQHQDRYHPYENRRVCRPHKNEKKAREIRGPVGRFRVRAQDSISRSKKNASTTWHKAKTPFRSGNDTVTNFSSRFHHNQLCKLIIKTDDPLSMRSPLLWCSPVKHASQESEPFDCPIYLNRSFQLHKTPRKSTRAPALTPSGKIVHLSKMILPNGQKLETTRNKSRRTSASSNC